MGTFEHKGRIVRAEIRAEAGAELAWRAWANPARFAQWRFLDAVGELKRGSEYKLVLGDGNVAATYEVVDVEAGRRFVLRSGRRRAPEVVEVSVEGDSAHSVIRVVQSGLPKGAHFDEECQRIANDWRHDLATLALYLERYFGRDPDGDTFSCMRLASRGTLQPYFASDDGLCAWLATSATTGPEGSRYVFELVGGGRASGRVLVDTGDHVTLAWDEIDGLLTFSLNVWSDGLRIFDVVAMSWRQGALDAFRPALRAAIKRLAKLLPPLRAPKKRQWRRGCEVRR